MIIYILFGFLLSCTLFFISKEDIKTMLISENKLRLFALSGILYLTFEGLTNRKTNTIDLIKNNFCAMIIIFFMLYAISYISNKLLGINSLGIGDIKLSSFSSIWLGLKLSLISLTISFSLSAIYSIYGKVNKRFKPFHQYPFAPFLSIGIIICWILDKI